MSDDWREALARTPECVDIARFGEELSDAESAHLDTCVRCQSELALYRDVMQEDASPESEWIAGELRRRNNVVAFRPKARAVWGAVAAALVIVIGASTWMQFREPSIDPAVDSPIYRSARLEVVSPRGDLAQAPNELRWKAVPLTSQYRVRIMEVDATLVWSGDTTATHIVLPREVVAQFAPGKSLRWDVRAFRGNEELASSETQTIRVTP